ncbi:MAG TPA: ABC transporter permease [Candidatus Hydrogenedentes bacterium]|nr:MAG: Ribose transport system permease protein RbsC [Candidatus Hydrogenedentes bacterium ADurb.Bin101]HOC69691.1 ABC transporter permease [Candidatus Hydrogenedentota bacterium]HQM99763.1 ABC transporter permease [Candidatus Hydrogenedentota bacterium]
MNTAKRLIPLVGASIALMALFRILVPGFLNPENLVDLVQQISVNAIIAFGMTFCILIGGIDLSVGAVLAVVGTTAVYVLGYGEAETQSLFRFFLAVGAGLVVAALFGAFNGVCAARTKMPPFIITLATMMVARGAALRFNQGRPISIPAHETLFLGLGNGRIAGVLPVPVLVMLVILVISAVLLHRTRFGQHLYGIGGNREAARFTGIAVGRAEITVYILCALFTGIAGIIATSQLYSAEPASGAGFELNAIAAAVVGGTSFTGGIGSIPGTFIGAVIIGTLDKGLNQAGVHFSYQYILKGLVILTAVYFDVRRKKT